jgi:hypothetical protein
MNKKYIVRLTPAEHAQAAGSSLASPIVEWAPGSTGDGAASWEAPAGHGRWAVHLLADKLAELQVVERISHETGRKMLKKTNQSPIDTNAIVFPRSRTPSLSLP